MRFKALSVLTLATTILITGCVSEPKSTRPAEPTITVSDSSQEESSGQIKIGQAMRVKNQKNENIFAFTVKSVERDAYCRPLGSAPKGKAAQINFSIKKTEYDTKHKQSIYNPLGWSYEYSDGSKSDSSIWSTMQLCTPLQEDTDSHISSNIDDGKVTVILPDKPGYLVYKDIATGAVFKLPLD